MFERGINSRLVFEFSKRTGRIETLTNSDLDVVREVVFVRVDADSELVSNGLAVDWDRYNEITDLDRIEGL